MLAVKASLILSDLYFKNIYLGLNREWAIESCSGGSETKYRAVAIIWPRIVPMEVDIRLWSEVELIGSADGFKELGVCEERNEE